MTTLIIRLTNISPLDQSFESDKNLTCYLYFTRKSAQVFYFCVAIFDVSKRKFSQDQKLMVDHLPGTIPGCLQ